MTNRLHIRITYPVRVPVLVFVHAWARVRHQCLVVLFPCPAVYFHCLPALFLSLAPFVSAARAEPLPAWIAACVPALKGEHVVAIPVPIPEESCFLFFATVNAE